LKKTLASKAIPLFFELLEEFSDFNEPKQSRNRIMLIADETRSTRSSVILRRENFFYRCYELIQIEIPSDQIYSPH
jgi:hypothetical protein